MGKNRGGTLHIFIKDAALQLRATGDGRSPDLRVCQMALPVNFRTVSFMGHAPVLVHPLQFQGKETEKFGGNWKFSYF